MKIVAEFEKSGLRPIGPGLKVEMPKDFEGQIQMSRSKMKTKYNTKTVVIPGGKQIPMRNKMNNKSVATMISEGLIRYVTNGGGGSEDPDAIDHETLNKFNRSFRYYLGSKVSFHIKILNGSPNSVVNILAIVSCSS